MDCLCWNISSGVAWWELRCPVKACIYSVLRRIIALPERERKNHRRRKNTEAGSEMLLKQFWKNALSETQSFEVERHKHGMYLGKGEGFIYDLLVTTSSCL